MNRQLTVSPGMVRSNFISQPKRMVVSSLNQNQDRKHVQNATVQTDHFTCQFSYEEIHSWLSKLFHPFSLVQVCHQICRCLFPLEWVWGWGGLETRYLLLCYICFVKQRIFDRYLLTNYRNIFASFVFSNNCICHQQLPRRTHTLWF